MGPVQVLTSPANGQQTRPPAAGREPIVEITYAQAVDALQALRTLAQERASLRLAYRLTRWIEHLEPVVREFFKRRDDLIVELGDEGRPATKQELLAGRPETIFEVRDEYMRTFLEREKALRAETVTIRYRPLAMEELRGLSACAARDILALGPCLERLEEEED